MTLQQIADYAAGYLDLLSIAVDYQIQSNRVAILPLDKEASTIYLYTSDSYMEIVERLHEYLT